MVKRCPLEPMCVGYWTRAKHRSMHLKHLKKKMRMTQCKRAYGVEGIAPIEWHPPCAWPILVHNQFIASRTEHHGFLRASLEGV